MNTKLKSLFLGIALALSSALVGQAQTTKHPEAPAPSTKQLQPGSGAGFSEDSLGVSTNAITPAWTYGWNFVHLNSCQTYYSGGYAYLYVYPTEGGYFYTTDTAFQAALHPACQSGNWVGFWVYDYDNHWNYVNTYSYK